MDSSSSPAASEDDLLAHLAGNITDDMFDSVMQTGLRTGRAAAMRAFVYAPNIFDTEGVTRIVLLAKLLQSEAAAPKKGHARHAYLVAMACMVWLNKEAGHRTETPKMAELRTVFPKDLCNDFARAILAEVDEKVVWRKDPIPKEVLVSKEIANDGDVLKWINMSWPDENASALSIVMLPTPAPFLGQEEDES
jgi:hypothetical protein